MWRRPLRTAAVVVVLCLLAGACSDYGRVPTRFERVRVWLPSAGAGLMQWMNTTGVHTFEAQNQGVRVDVTFVPADQYQDRLAVAFGRGDGPDLYGDDVSTAAQHARDGRAYALDTEFASVPGQGRSDMTFLGDGRVDGQQYGVPLRGTGYLLAYRADLFRKAKLDPDRPPRSLRRLRHDAERLTVRRKGKIVRPGLVLPADDPDRMAASFSTFLYQDGGALAKADRPAWNSAAGKRTLRYLTGLYRGRHAVANGLGDATSSTGAGHPLATGQAPMALVDEPTLASIAEQKPAVLRYLDVAPPFGKRQISFGHGTDALFMNPASRHKGAAWSFMRYLIEPPGAKGYALAAGGIASRSSLATDPDVRKLSYLNPYMEAGIDFRGEPQQVGWADARDQLAAAVSASLRGKRTPDKALDVSARKAAKLLAAQ